MKYWIDRQVSCTNVVTPKFWWSRKWNARFLEKRAYPD